MQAVANNVILLLFPPLMLGVIARTKAYFAGRRGMPLLQAYHDIAKLMRKSSVTSDCTTWLFAAGPAIGLTSVLSAGQFVPVGGPAAAQFTGDFVLFCYLLGLGRFFIAVAALDTGSSFEGMGAAREVTFGSFAEPAMFLALLGLARLGQSMSLGDLTRDALWGGAATGVSIAGASMALIAIVLFLLVLAENCRIPFDDPNTHLELTMIHEVMVLDHGGPALGVVLYAAAMKVFVMGALLVTLFVPHGLGPAWLDRGVFLGGMLLLSVAIGVVESTMARLRLTRLPTLLTAASLLAGFALLLLVRTA